MAVVRVDWIFFLFWWIVFTSYGCRIDLFHIGEYLQNLPHIPRLKLGRLASGWFFALTASIWNASKCISFNRRLMHICIGLVIANNIVQRYKMKKCVHWKQILSSYIYSTEIVYCMNTYLFRSLRNATNNIIDCRQVGWTGQFSWVRCKRCYIGWWCNWTQLWRRCKHTNRENYKNTRLHHINIHVQYITF